MRLLYLATSGIDRRFLKALQELGHAVECQAAEDAGHTDAPEGVIIDLVLPSPEWAARLAATWPAAFHVQLVRTNERASAALRAGADACFARPLEVREIAGRLEAAARRAKSDTAEDAFALSPRDRRLMTGGQTLQLTPREYLIVELLARRPGQVLSAEEIGAHIWGTEASGDPARVRASISRLATRSLRLHGWRLVSGGRGRGYRLEARHGD